MSEYCDRIDCNCKYCDKEGCHFFSQGSGLKEDMPCYVYEKETFFEELEKYREGVKQIKEQINDFKGCDMYEEANALELALEFLGVKENCSE